MQAQNQKNVIYKVEYSEQNGTCGGVNFDPLSLTVPVFSTVLDIMEIAARMGQNYQFVITFTEVNGNAAYTVDAINDTRSEPPCYWSYVVQSGEKERAPRVGIAEYVPGNDFRVILRYGQLHANGIATSYTIEHPDPVCTSATPPSRLSAINTPLGSTAMDVMEEAVRENGHSYRFSTEYVLFMIGVDGVSEKSYGHVVRQIGDVAENNS